MDDVRDLASRVRALADIENLEVTYEESPIGLIWARIVVNVRDNDQLSVTSVSVERRVLHDDLDQPASIEQHRASCDECFQRFKQGFRVSPLTTELVQRMLQWKVDSIDAYPHEWKCCGLAIDDNG